MIVGLAQGRIVQYVLATEDVDSAWLAKNPIPEGRTVCGLIVRVVDPEKGIVNLTLFPDWESDGFLLRNSALPQPVGIGRKAGVEFKEPEEGVLTPGTWHYPQRA